MDDRIGLDDEVVGSGRSLSRVVEQTVGRPM